MARLSAAILLAGCLFAAPSCGGSNQEAESADQSENKAAVTAAEAWLKMLDEGNYDGSWSQSATVFRVANGSPANWAGAGAEMRGPLGRVVGRRLKEAARTNLQESSAYALAFDTAFESRPSATEEVTVVLDGGFWRVAGYMVR